ncbi:MAG: hypothetical protein JSR66_18285 [Proteobacteria bacterium]|nr:hypothetical protein [Pseudomonadota bacterium]
MRRSSYIAVVAACLALLSLLQPQYKASAGAAEMALQDSQVLAPEGPSVAEWFANFPHSVNVRIATSDELIAAIAAANTSGRRTTIHVAPGTYQFTQQFASANGASFLPPIAGAIRIVGDDPTTTILDGGQGVLRAFTVLQGAHLLVRNLTLQNFSNFCSIDDCPSNGGGAVENVGGNLRIEHSVLNGNAVYEIDGAQTFGGHIYSLSGRVEIESSTLTNGFALDTGGGMAIVGGSLVLSHSTVSNNHVAEGCCRSQVQTFGGGLYLDSAKAWILHSTFTGNTSSDPPGDLDVSLGNGAAINNGPGGRIWVFDSSITNNRGYNAGFGGGLSNQGRMVIVNTTVAGNTAGSGGGGIFNFGDLSLQGVTITGNSAVGPGYYPNCLDPLPVTGGFCDRGAGGFGADASATTRIATSVIAGNLTAGDCSGVLITEGHNAFGSTCELQPAQFLGHANPHDLLDIDARLGALVDDGQPGNGHVPLLSDSPLIDAGGEIGRFCTPRDQIGERRVRGRGGRGEALCDIGAVELQPPR